MTHESVTLAHTVQDGVDIYVGCVKDSTGLPLVDGLRPAVYASCWENVPALLEQLQEEMTIKKKAAMPAI